MQIVRAQTGWIKAHKSPFFYSTCSRLADAFLGISGRPVRLGAVVFVAGDRLLLAAMSRSTCTTGRCSIVTCGDLPSRGFWRWASSVLNVREAALAGGVNSSAGDFCIFFALRRVDSAAPRRRVRAVPHCPERRKSCDSNDIMSSSRPPPAVSRQVFVRLRTRNPLGLHCKRGRRGGSLTAFVSSRNPVRGSSPSSTGNGRRSA
jgi:hypothetical protein